MAMWIVCPVNKMVLVFKTDVTERELAQELTQSLLSSFPHSKVNFDLEDCDKILRIEGHSIDPEKIIQQLTLAGVLCQSLE